MAKSYDSICCFRGSDKPSAKRLLWEITTICNLSCSFCHRTKEIDYGPDFQRIKDVLPVLKDFGIKEIIISGGEPLLRKDIFDIIDLMKNEGFDVDMCTNGTLITYDIAKKLSEYLTEISVSIDSSFPSNHDALRGKTGAFNSAISGIRSLQKFNVSVHTISIVKSSSINEIKSTVNFLAELGILSMAFIGHIPIGTGINELFTENNQKLLKNIFNELRNTYSDIAINTKELIEDSTMKSCMAGENVFGLDVKMLLKPCILHSKCGGIDINGISNDTVNVENYLRKIKENVLITNCSGQGICPGSKFINKV